MARYGAIWGGGWRSRRRKSHAIPCQISTPSFGGKMAHLPMACPVDSARVWCAGAPWSERKLKLKLRQGEASNMGQWMPCRVGGKIFQEPLPFTFQDFYSGVPNSMCKRSKGEKHRTGQKARRSPSHVENQISGFLISVYRTIPSSTPAKANTKPRSCALKGSKSKPTTNSPTRQCNPAQSLDQRSGAKLVGISDQI